MATKKKKPKVKNKPKAKAKRPVKESPKRPKSKAKAKGKLVKAPAKNPLESEKSFLLKVPYKDFNLHAFYIKYRAWMRDEEGVEEGETFSGIQHAITSLGTGVNACGFPIADFETDENFDFLDDEYAFNCTKSEIEKEDAFHFFVLGACLINFEEGDECPFIDGTTFTVDEEEAGSQSWYGVLLKKQGGSLYFFKAGLYPDMGERITAIDEPTKWDDLAKNCVLSHTKGKT